MTSGIIQEHSSVLMTILKIFDILFFIGAAWLTFYLRFATWVMPYAYQIVVLISILLILVLFNVMQLYQPWRGRPVQRPYFCVSQ